MRDNILFEDVARSLERNRERIRLRFFEKIKLTELSLHELCIRAARRSCIMWRVLVD